MASTARRRSLFDTPDFLARRDRCCPGSCFHRLSPRNGDYATGVAQEDRFEARAKSTRSRSSTSWNAFEVESLRVLFMLAA